MFEVGKVSFYVLGTHGFHGKAENEKLTAAGSRCRENLKYKSFMSFARLHKKCTKDRAARAEQLFFLGQPIVSLRCGVIVALSVVMSETRELRFDNATNQ